MDYQKLKTKLQQELSIVENEFLQGKTPEIESTLIPSFDEVFRSRTQAYREVLLGCVLARIEDKAVDIHKPYMNQGPNAYNGRTLDERVINPFFQENHIPSSRGPFLSTFRRSVAFEKSTRDGLRDKKGFDALLLLIDYLTSKEDDEVLKKFLRYLLYRFVRLREEATIPISRLQRISLEQYRDLINELLNIPSGGRFPVLLIEAVFVAIKEIFNLSWKIDTQGINVADGASGVGGDISIKEEDKTLLAAEITERPVGKNRVVSTFNTKIIPYEIEDYLFFIKSSAVQDEAIYQARQYFSQGHEINFLEMKEWILMVLATLGKKGRAIFNRVLVERISDKDFPTGLKIAWNNQIARLTSI